MCRLLRRQLRRPLALLTYSVLHWVIATIVGLGVGRGLTKLQIPCACCNSGSGSDEAVLTKAEELNESYPDYKNRSLAEPGPSEQVP